jgi:outer membrane protein TolC
MALARNAIRISAPATIDPPSRVRLAARIRAVLPLLLALPGCTTAPLAPPARLSDGARRACPAGSARWSRAHWWPCLGDAQLSALIEHALAALPTPALRSAQDNLTAAIARRYIALRAQQTALVLLAAREELDSQLVAMARQPTATRAAPHQQITTAEAQLMDTRADQVRARAAIAMFHVELAVLTGSAPETLDHMPGGPIPLPAAPLPGVESYAAAQLAAARAQSQALSAIAAAQTLRAHTAGLLPTRETLAADRRALAALQDEEQARAAMTEAYVLALAGDPSGR